MNEISVYSKDYLGNLYNNEAFSVNPPKGDWHE